ncbi:C69 family dipeptidase [Limosilactobacillus caecicola]|uniref:C69 family dipeptidase n=1 Tax=Limosilactobacillus caecicola TaxID=2941332 RepID=UPI002041C1D4|nr:C69 family dipeptidase [Limosilactobacillus caecicola]
MRNSACTSIMVGKQASIDGSTFISRNEDRVVPIEPKQFLVRPAVTGRHETYVSPYNQLTVPLPENGMRYTSTPHVDQSMGPNEEDGFNEANVGESATESVYANARVLAYDPYIKNGLAEDSMTTLVLPYIHSAREGVEYLGKLVATYGSAEGNGVQFIDQNEVWYMEIATGHQWVAVRIPDDCYAIAPNQIMIEQIDFQDPDNYMWSEGIRQFVTEHDLNPDHDQWNFRHIFGTRTRKDRHYNTPRVWFAQRYLSPQAAADQQPEDMEMPFIRKAERKISVEDIEYLLGSHFNETKYDPLGDGTPDDKRRYRSIALSRTAQSHILQVRPHDTGTQAVQWINFGIPTFSAYVPFFGNATDTDVSYRDLPKTMDFDHTFWLDEALAEIVEAHLEDFYEDDQAFLKDMQAWTRRKLHNVDVTAAQKTGDDLTKFLTEQNHEIAQYCNEQTRQLIFKLLSKGTTLSKLTFKLDPNL